MDQNKIDSFNIIREAIFDMRIAVDDADEVAYDLWDKVTDNEENPEDVEYYSGRLKDYMSKIAESVDQINKELGLIKE